MNQSQYINNTSIIRNGGAAEGERIISLEKDIIIEYENLVANVDRMNQLITRINTTEVLNLINKLRTLEKKVGLVYTLFKASVYSLVTADHDIMDNSNDSDNRNRFSNEQQQQQNTNRPIF